MSVNFIGGNIHKMASGSNSSSDLKKSLSPIREDSKGKISEIVVGYAINLYKELDELIEYYGEDVGRRLIPLIVKMLNGLEAAYKTNQDQELEFKHLQKDHEVLLLEYERVKSGKISAEMNVMRIADLFEDHLKECEKRRESLNSLKLELKNNRDEATRHTYELWKHFYEIHDKNKQFFNTYKEQMERKKIIPNPISKISKVQLAGSFLECQFDELKDWKDAVIRSGIRTRTTVVNASELQDKLFQLMKDFRGLHVKYTDLYKSHVENFQQNKKMSNTPSECSEVFEEIDSNTSKKTRGSSVNASEQEDALLEDFPPSASQISHLIGAKLAAAKLEDSKDQIQ